MPNTTPQTAGQLMLEDAIPEDLRYPGMVLDKKGVSRLLSELAQKHPDRFKEVSYKLMQIGRQVSHSTGGGSFDAQHLRMPKKAYPVREKLLAQLQTIDDDPRLTDEEREAKTIEALEAAIPEQEKAIFDAASAEGNPLAKQVASGSRGNKSNLANLLGGPLLYRDHRGRPIPVPVLRSYSQGLTPAEYWASTYGSRKGITDVKLLVQSAGYLAKQLAQATHRLQVRDMDGPDGDQYPTTVRGLPTTPADEDNVGALLAHSVGGYPRNTVLTPKILADLQRKKVKSMVVRSPLVGGAPDGGLYARDVGVRETGKLPEVGSFPGITGAQALAEPISQSSLSSKHSAGSGDAKAVGGFPAINQIFQGSPNFVGSATHAELDGQVKDIKPSPAGGFHVTVAGKDRDGEIQEARHYVPAFADVKIKAGDTVEAGDTLSTGLPNVSKYVEHKGLGEGRRLFVETLRDQLNASNIPHHRRNVELLARGMVNYVQLDKELGDYAPGDVVPYHLLEQSYKPRKDSEELPVNKSVGRYLESPVLHYAVGDRIRPSMAKTLADNGIQNLKTHRDPVGFSPRFVRGEAVLQHDPDWMTQMYGSHLQGSLLKSVHRGAVSDREGSSFVPGLASGGVPGANINRRKTSADEDQYQPTAVVVKGNPEHLESQAELAEPFYGKLRSLLEDQGFAVTEDPGEPETMPPEADLWVGHSRGNDRFRFAPTEQTLIRLGDNHPDALNDPDDSQSPLLRGQTPTEAHYRIPPGLEEKIREVRRKIDDKGANAKRLASTPAILR